MLLKPRQFWSYVPAASLLVVAVLLINGCSQMPATASQASGQEAVAQQSDAAATPEVRRREAVGAAEDVVRSEWGIRGTGDDLTDLAEMPAGPATVAATYTGVGPFTVDLQDQVGNLIQRVAASSGAANASTTVIVPAAGMYQFKVRAAGPWELIVSYPETGVVEESAP
jgi:hypothetical protein